MNEQKLLNDAKQGALAVSTSALEIFDFIETYGMQAMARPSFLELLGRQQQARKQLFDALQSVGEANLGYRL